jgi:hypothetical protein
MTNYTNGKIYKIESSLGNMVYYGSTTKQYLSQRMTKHRGSYKQWLEGKVGLVTAYKLFEEYGLENCKIILVENYPCESKDALTSREAYFIRNFECVNKYVPHRTGKEYYEDNKERMSEQMKQYRLKNIEKIAEYQKEYREINKNKLIEYHKEYRDINRVKKAEHDKQYYYTNKEKISEQRKIKYTCICGSCICKDKKLRHERSIKHIKFLESQ